MSVGDYSELGQLGERIPLDPCLSASLVRPAPPVVVKHSILRRSKAAEEAPTELVVPILIFEFSVTGIAFAIPEDESLTVDEMWKVRFEEAETEIVVTRSYEVDGGEAWGAMFTDSRPALLRSIEESAFHWDVEGEEARWNSGRD